MSIGTTFGLNEQQLIAYAHQDDVGGWDKDAGRWPVGSIWSVEGKAIYALVRMLQPDIAVEVGTYHGCSAEHIAAALRDNGKGKVYCVDNAAWGVAPGHMIADWALAYIEFVNADAGDWFDDNPDIAAGVGFVFEDGDHSPELCERVWGGATQHIQAGGMIVGHDAMHFLVGDDVRKGIIASGVPNPHFYLIEPSDCGLAVARLPDDPRKDEPVAEVEAAPKPKARTRRKKTETRELEKAG